MPIVNEAERHAAVVMALLARMAHLEASIVRDDLQAAVNRLRLRVLSAELLEARRNLSDVRMRRVKSFRFSAPCTRGMPIWAGPFASCRRLGPCEAG